MEQIELPKKLIISDALRKILKESDSAIAKKLLKIKDVTKCPNYINYLDIAKDDASKISYLDEKRYKANYYKENSLNPEIGDIIIVNDARQYYRGSSNGFDQHYGKEVIVTVISQGAGDADDYILKGSAVDGSFINFGFRAKDFIRLDNRFWNPKSRYMGRCGADDRVGISLSIEMFRQHPNIKLFFPMDEESMGTGSNHCNVKFFEDCCFMIQPDRNMYKNKRDYINHTNGIQVTTNEFDRAVRSFMKEYKYTTGRGTFTDIGELVLNGANICCFNLSCYLNAHTDQETVWIPLYEDALNFVNDVIVNLSYRQWPLPKREVMNYSKYGYDWEDISHNKYCFPKEEELDYFDVAMDQAYSCNKNCCGEYTEIQLDNSIFCTKCQKTLGETVLIDTSTRNKSWENSSWYD